MSTLKAIWRINATHVIMYLLRDWSLSYMENSYNSTTTKQNNLIETWAKGLNRPVSKDDTQMDDRHMERCSASLIIREMQIKTTETYRLTPSRMVTVNNKNKWWWGCGDIGTLCTVGGDVKRCSSCGKLEAPQELKHRIIPRPSSPTYGYVPRRIENKASEIPVHPWWCLNNSVTLPDPTELYT